jgi:hypothetical protein
MCVGLLIVTFRACVLRKYTCLGGFYFVEERERRMAVAGKSYRLMLDQAIGYVKSVKKAGLS